MAEIRLICPGCAAEYRVPDNAIPPEGREVECSACSNVWLATARPLLPAPVESPAEAPRLSRRVPDSVLDILRDEVEHERRARAVEQGSLPPATPAPATPLRPSPDPEWPATTITRHVDLKAAEPAALPAQPQPEPFAIPARPVSLRPAKTLPQSTAPAPEQPAAPVRQALPLPVPMPAPRPARNGYGAGFGLAAMLAAASVGLYLLAPTLADQGAFGERVMQLRGQVDEARLWLQDRASALTR